MNTNTRFRRRLLSAALAMALPVAFVAQADPDRSGIWWNPSESGWGVFTVDQGSVLLPTWYTYDENGDAVWYLVTGAREQTDGSYTGAIYSFTGVPFAQIAGTAADPGQQVGEAVLRFPDDDAMDFSFTVDGVTRTRSLSRFQWPDQMDVACAPATGPVADSDNHTALWWTPSESGWGLQLTEVADTIVATWYTYGEDGRAVWMIANTSRQSNGSFTGDLLQGTSGTPYSDDFEGIVPPEVVGTATLTFSDGANGSFTYTVGSVTQTKQIERSQFGDTVTTCSTIDRSDEGGGGGGGGGGGAGPDECLPPLAVGNRFRYRSTDGEGGVGEVEQEVVGTGTWEGNAVFILEDRPLPQQSAGSIREFVAQTASERIYYGSEGYIPEVDAIGTSRFEPPLRVPRSTPVGYEETFEYQIIVEYTAMGQSIESVIDVVEHTRRTGTGAATSPAGSFSDACIFDSELQTEIEMDVEGFTTRVTTDGSVRQWSHPDVGAVRSESVQSSIAEVSGAPFPIPPTVVDSEDVAELVSATVEGREYP